MEEEKTGRGIKPRSSLIEGIRGPRLEAAKKPYYGSSRSGLGKQAGEAPGCLFLAGDGLVERARIEGMRPRSCRIVGSEPWRWVFPRKLWTVAAGCRGSETKQPSRFGVIQAKATMFL